MEDSALSYGNKVYKEDQVPRDLIIYGTTFWLLMLIFLFMGSTIDIIDQIVFGNTRFGVYSTKFMDWTNKNVKSRLLLPFWFLKIMIASIIILLTLFDNEKLAANIISGSLFTLAY